MENTRRAFLTAALRGGATAVGVAATGYAQPVGAAPRIQASVLLLECHVAGTSYADLPEGIEQHLPPGTRLSLTREPENPVDALAIRVLDPSGRKLGYLPRAKNEVLARLLDAGIPIYAEVVSTERINAWLKIELQVWMRRTGR